MGKIIRLVLLACVISIGLLSFKLLLKHYPQIIQNRMLRIAISVVFLVLCVCGLIFPTENLVCSFNTVEEVSSFITAGEIIDVLYGENSSMVIYSNSAKSVIRIFPRKDNRYLVPGPNLIVEDATIWLGIDGSASIVHTGRNPDQYIYVILFSKSVETPVVSDNCKTQFKMIRNEDSENNTIHPFFCYGVFKGDTSSYRLIVNGTEYNCGTGDGFHVQKG